MKRTSRFLSVCTCFVLLVSCDTPANDIFNRKKNDVIDPAGNLTREDFKQAHNPVEIAKQNATDIYGNPSEPPIPDLAEILAAPKPPKIGATQLVSVAVTDDVPLKDVLIELARLAEVDIEVDAGISGGVSFRAKDRPFNEVIERIADLAGLRYHVKNNVLRVERDTPYIQTYALDMLNVDRSASGNFGISSGGGGGSSGGAEGGASGGGDSSQGATSSMGIKADFKGEFWEKFKESMDSIMGYQEVSKTSEPGIPSQAAPAATPADPANPQAAPAATPTPATSGPGNGNTAGSFYSLNRQAATLTVSGTEHQHEIVRRFLNAIESNVSSQVLIEAKIVEVTLNDNYQSGIDWSNFGSGSSSALRFTGDFNDLTPTNTDIPGATISVLADNIFGSGIDLSAAVKLLDEFGTSRALSSPRLNAMNNQQAVMSFVENLIYFDVEVKVTDKVPATTVGGTDTPAKVEVTSEPKKAPVGITLALQPSINKETNEVTLSVRPTLSKVIKFVSDPGFEVSKAQAAAQLPAGSPIITTLNSIKSEIPQLEVRELDSILKVKSGQVMVIGGLLEDKVTNSDAGVPGVAEVPYIGNLFKNVQKTNTKKELVILLRATIVSPHGSADNADKALYNKFIQDPRPINFQ